MKNTDILVMPVLPACKALMNPEAHCRLQADIELILPPGCCQETAKLQIQGYCWAVIDTCLVNQMVYDPVAKTQIHATVPCPKTASKQRAGRTGRTIPGINIKLITQQEWDNLPDTEPPQPQLEDPVPILSSTDEALHC